MSLCVGHQTRLRYPASAIPLSQHFTTVLTKIKKTNKTAKQQNIGKSKEKAENVTVKGRKVKPLLRAMPVRAIPKSTPREKPPLQFASFFLRSAFGGSSSKVNAVFRLWVEFNFDKD